jgi:putative Ca2+/H+ antiporter (TMEM165/GDT1 family)
MNEVITTLASVPFAIAITALLRKRWPVIDGAYVALVVLALTVLGAVLSHYHAAIPPEVWTAAAPVLAAILALGGVTTAQHVVNPPSEWPDEAPTRKEGKL